MVAPNRSAEIESSARAPPEIRLVNGASGRSRLSFYMTEFKVLLLFPRFGREEWVRVSFTTGLGAMAARRIVSPRSILSAAIG